MRHNKLVLLLFFLAATLCSCGEAEEKNLGENGYHELEQAQQNAVDLFLATHAKSGEGGAKDTLVLCRAADLNNDGILDVVLLYTPAAGTQPVPDHQGNAMCVLISTPTGYAATNSLPAPQERQSIQFRDIDGKPPLEFIVSGYKGAKTGLAIYRVQGVTVENLFGESMDDCC